MGLFKLKLILLMHRYEYYYTSGISGVDDAQDSGLAVLLGCEVSSVQFFNVQCPAVGFIQIVVNVHCLQLWDGCRVEWVLRDGNHHTCPGPAFTRHQQLQNALQTPHITFVILMYITQFFNKMEKMKWNIILPKVIQCYLKKKIIQKVGANV